MTQPYAAPVVCLPAAFVFVSRQYVWRMDSPVPDAYDSLRLAAFFASLFHFDREAHEESFVSLVGPDFEMHFVNSPPPSARTAQPARPPAPREQTPLQLPVHFASAQETASKAIASGDVDRRDARTWPATTSISSLR